MAGVVQEELPLQQVPSPVQCRRYRFIALLGASMVLLSVAGKPSVQVRADAGCALTGFLLWLLGVTHPLFPAGLAAATAKLSLVLEKTKRLFFGRQEPAAAPA